MLVVSLIRPPLYPPPLNANGTMIVGAVLCGVCVLSLAQVLKARFVDDFRAKNLGVAHLQGLLGAHVIVAFGRQNESADTVISFADPGNIDSVRSAYCSSSAHNPGADRCCNAFWDWAPPR